MLLIIAGATIANAQTTSQNQPGRGNTDTRVSVAIFPNPVIDIVTITFDIPVKDPIVETFNVNGQKVLAPTNEQGAGSNKTDVDLSGAAPGTYVIRVRSGNEIIHVQKIIKK